jgi:hypothetical protein
MPLTLDKLIKAVKIQRARAIGACEHEVLSFRGGPGRLSVCCPACGLMLRSGAMKLPPAVKSADLPECPGH